MPDETFAPARKRRKRRYLEDAHRYKRFWGILGFFATLISGLFYLVWLTSVLNFDVWYISLLFVLAEAIALFGTVTAAACIWHPRFHELSGLPIDGLPPTVDVLISTAGEPVEMVTATVVAALNIRYPRKTIYILDDGDSAEIEELTRRLGCEYIARPEHADAKAGNLNYALRRTTGGLILALDADQIPDPDILEQLVGYLGIPGIGWAQSAQRFDLPSGDPFGNSDDLFYQVMQNSKDNDNAAFSCGSGVLYRRAALESVGGFSTWNLVEDVHTSMRMHAKGWRSVYHNHPLTTGTAPANIRGVYKQRQQWATDSLRLLFWDNPLRQVGLTMPQKLQYFQTGFGYLMSATIMPIYLVLPAICLFMGVFIAETDPLEYAVIRGMYFLCSIGMLTIMQWPFSVARSFRRWAGLAPVHLRAAYAALRSRNEKPEYNVTDKDQAELTMTRRLFAVLPQALLIVVGVISIIYAFAAHTISSAAIWINTVWALFVIWSLFWICRAALQNRQPAQR